MAKQQDLKTTIEGLLRERLADFKVPHEVRAALVDDIMGAIEAPNRKKHGATVMTHEASLAADQERRHGADPSRAKPRVV